MVEVAPLKTDWGKIQACKERVGENPLDYLERLRNVYECHSGLPDDGVPLSHAFVSGLATKLQAEVKPICVGWETKNVKDLLPFINHCSSLIEQRSAETTAKLMHAHVCVCLSLSD